MALNQLRYPFAEQASQINGFVLKEKKSIYCWTRSRPTRTFGESNDQVRDKSESKYQRVQDKSETIEKRLETGLEYYSPTRRSFQPPSRSRSSTATRPPQRREERPAALATVAAAPRLEPDVRRKVWSGPGKRRQGQRRSPRRDTGPPAASKTSS